jgi:hypothetical protein
VVWKEVHEHGDLSLRSWVPEFVTEVVAAACLILQRRAGGYYELFRSRQLEE